MSHSKEHGSESETEEVVEEPEEIKDFTLQQILSDTTHRSIFEKLLTKKGERGLFERLKKDKITSADHRALEKRCQEYNECFQRAERIKSFADTDLINDVITHSPELRAISSKKSTSQEEINATIAKMIGSSDFLLLVSENPKKFQGLVKKLEAITERKEKFKPRQEKIKRLCEKYGVETEEVDDALKIKDERAREKTLRKIIRKKMGWLGWGANILTLGSVTKKRARAITGRTFVFGRKTRERKEIEALSKEISNLTSEVAGGLALTIKGEEVEKILKEEWTKATSEKKEGGEEKKEKEEKITIQSIRELMKKKKIKEDDKFQKFIRETTEKKDVDKLDDLENDQDSLKKIHKKLKDLSDDDVKKTFNFEEGPEKKTEGKGRESAEIVGNGEGKFEKEEYRDGKGSKKKRWTTIFIEGGKETKYIVDSEEEQPQEGLIYHFTPLLDEESKPVYVYPKKPEARAKAKKVGILVKLTEPYPEGHQEETLVDEDETETEETTPTTEPKPKQKPTESELQEETIEYAEEMVRKGKWKKGEFKKELYEDRKGKQKERWVITSSREGVEIKYIADREKEPQEGQAYYFAPRDYDREGKIKDHYRTEDRSGKLIARGLLVELKPPYPGEEKPDENETTDEGTDDTGPAEPSAEPKERTKHKIPDSVISELKVIFPEPEKQEKINILRNRLTKALDEGWMESQQIRNILDLLKKKDEDKIFEVIEEIRVEKDDPREKKDTIIDIENAITYILREPKPKKDIRAIVPPEKGRKQVREESPQEKERKELKDKITRFLDKTAEIIEENERRNWTLNTLNPIKLALFENEDQRQYEKAIGLLDKKLVENYPEDIKKIFSSVKDFILELKELEKRMPKKQLTNKPKTDTEPPASDASKPEEKTSTEYERSEEEWQKLIEKVADENIFAGDYLTTIDENIAARAFRNALIILGTVRDAEEDDTKREFIQKMMNVAESLKIEWEKENPPKPKKKGGKKARKAQQKEE